MPRLPDFYIIGAQKSGTASLVSLLTSASDVFVCNPREPMFFCRDDVDVHPQTLLSNPDLWRAFDWERRNDELLTEYAQLFSAAGADQLACDTSNTYLVARHAPRRIAQVTPHAKLITVLRNPIDRAYSAYYHHLKNFRVVHRFEDHIRFEPGDILSTGNYKRHLERYLAYFSREQMLVLAFEELIADQRSVSNRVCDFLGLPHRRPEAESVKANEALVPRFTRAQLVVNAALRWTGSSLEAGPLRALRSSDARVMPLRIMDKGLRGLGRLNRGRRQYPPMREQTRVLLRDYYARQNAGLSGLFGIDFAHWWKDFDML